MKKRILLSAMFLISILSFAQNGENDSTFNPLDFGFGSGDGLIGMLNDIKIQDDGKILIAGYFMDYNGKPYSDIMRLESDGSIDSSFNLVGSFDDIESTDGHVKAISIQTDGKIVAVGDFYYSYNGSRGIVKLNSDGSTDYSFNSSGGFGYVGVGNTVAIQDDGKIVVGGAFDNYGIHGIGNSLARIDPNGFLDTAFTFNTGTGFTGSLNSVVIQDNGKILVGGEFDSYNGTTRNRIARLNEDASIDNSFNPLGGFNGEVFSIAIQNDDKILVGGDFTSFDGTPVNRIARLNPDGTLDASFNVGTAFNNKVKKVTLQDNGKILIGGKFTSFNGNVTNKIVCLNSDGSIDNNFNLGSGIDYISNSQYAVINSFAVQDDDKIIVGGSFDWYNDTVRPNSIGRLFPNGFYDSGFNSSTGSDGGVFASAIQNDKKIIVGGEFAKINDMPNSRIARMKIDGEVDNSFDTGAGFNDKVNDVAIQDDGKIVVVGDFTEFDGNTVNGVARINPDGTNDQNFNIGTGIDFSINTGISVYAVHVQDDGKIIVGGNFEHFNGVSRNGVVRLNTDGSIDASFDTGNGVGGGINKYISDIAVQEDDKIIIGGSFNTFDGTSCLSIVRLNSNGTVDNSFNSGSGFDERVKSIALQNDGKILVGGYFSNFNGSPVNGIIRLNSDGSHDTSFDSGTGLTHVQSSVYVESIVIQNNGKIIIGGIFDTYDGENRNNIIRLHADGSIDESFEIGSGFDQPVYTMAFQENDELIVGGEFISYNGIGRNRIARLLTGCVDASVDIDWSVLTATNSNATYQWVDCDNNYAPVPNETSQVLTVTQDGNYAVVVTSNATNCVDTSNCINITNASVNDFFVANNLSIYPNPNNGSFTIDTDSAISVEVVNTVGRSILRKQLNIGQNKLTLNQMANGIYYLNLTDKQGNSGSKKISVIR